MTAPSVSQTVVGGGTAVSSFTLASWTPGANEFVDVAISLRDRPIGVTVTGVSGNGITFALVAAIEGTQDQERSERWRGQIASPSTGQITVTLSAACNAASAVAHSISGAAIGNNGADAVDAFATADTGATDTNAPSVNVTTTGADRLVIGSCSHRAAVFSVGAGETALSLNNAVGTSGDETRCSTEYQAVATASTVTINGTLGAATDWTMIAVAIKPATVAPPPALFAPRMPPAILAR